jgi:hypothetical protein
MAGAGQKNVQMSLLRVCHTKTVTRRHDYESIFVFPMAHFVAQKRRREPDRKKGKSGWPWKTGQ